jgi:hypothetical protein
MLAIARQVLLNIQATLLLETIQISIQVLIEG